MTATTQPTRVQPLRLLPPIAVVAVVLICAAAAAGWLSGLVQLRTVDPGWASMKLVTAACLSTLALALYVENRIGRPNRVIFTAVGLVAAAALVNGLSYVNVSSFGLESFFGRADTAGAPMSAATVVTVMTLVIGLVAGPHRRVAGQAAVLIGVTVPYVAMVGYLISVQGLYSFGPYGGMSISAAVACLLLAGGILTMDEWGWLRRLGARDDFSAVVVRRLVLPSLLLSPSLGYVARLGVELGWWDAAFSPVLIVTGTSLLSVALVGWVGMLLARLERQRLDAMTLAATSAAAQAFQHAVFAASPDIITVLDPSGSVLWANCSIPARLGYSVEDAASMGSHLGRVLIVAEDQEQYLATMAPARHATDDAIVQSDFRMLRKDGTTRWFSRRSAPLQRDEHGRVTRIVGITRDITDQMTVQAALVESENRFRQLADTVTVGFVLRSLDPPAFLYVSPGFVNIFGFDPMAESQESGATALRRVIHPDDWEQVHEPYWQKADAGIAIQAEFRVLRPDGEFRWITASSAPVLDPDGIIRRTATTSEDVTDRKRAEAAQLSADKLAQANALKDDMLSRMSHELRTPLNAVVGFAQLLELDELTTVQHDWVHHILGGARHLVELVDEVLDLTMIQGNAMALSTEAFAVTDLLAQTASLMQPLAATSGITLAFDSGLTGGLLVQADRRRLHQVLLNLLSNAIKFNRPGGRVDLTAHPAGDHLQITVTDTGWGINAADLPRLFTPFDRLNAPAAGIDGTGLGLTLSRDLMGAMGGTLRATSTEGVGSMFVASVPLSHP